LIIFREFPQEEMAKLDTGALEASYSVGAVALFPELKRSECKTDYSLHLIQNLRRRGVVHPFPY
jgi:hypothetical protein